VRSWCPETILFWEDATGFSKLPPTEDLEAAANTLLELYIYHNSPREINITQEIRLELLDRFDRKNYSVSMFEETLSPFLFLLGV